MTSTWLACGMFERVGECFLDDPVGGEFERDRQWLRFALDLERDVEAGAPDACKQFVDLLESGLRLVAGVAFADRAEQATQVGERCSADRLDRLERLARSLRTGIESVVAGGGVQNDDADVVGEHVVELASDARLFFGDGAFRFGLTFSLEAHGTFFERVPVDAPGLHVVADHPGEAEAEQRRDRRRIPLADDQHDRDRRCHGCAAG